MIAKITKRITKRVNLVDCMKRDVYDDFLSCQEVWDYVLPLCEPNMEDLNCVSDIRDMIAHSIANPQWLPVLLIIGG